MLSELGVQSVLLVPLLLGTEVMGWFRLQTADRRVYRAEEIAAAQTLAQHAALAVHMSRLAEQGKQTAVLQERNRIAREIHDTLAQGLVGLTLQLETVDALLSGRSHPAADDETKD